jgi:hypothetical protein
MSSDDQSPEWEVAQATRWAVRWRELEREALTTAGAMTDREARRHTLLIVESYKLLGERAKERSVRLARLASHMKKR